MLRLFVDFQNSDVQGRVRLNTVGVQRALTSGTQLRPGLAVSLYDGDMQIEGIAEYSSDEKIWAAIVDWELFKPIEPEEKTRS